MARKHVNIDNELQYIQNALNDGRATKQEISLDALEGKPGDANQARETPIDMDHVKRLAVIKDSGVELLAIVVFLCLRTGRMVVADGHHRWKEALVRGARSILAYVIQSTDIDADALFYSTMCNKMAILKQTPEDLKKACFMLFANKDWWDKSLLSISAHTGISYPSVRKYRALYSNSHKIYFPNAATSLEVLNDASHATNPVDPKSSVTPYKISFRSNSHANQNVGNFDDATITETLINKNIEDSLKYGLRMDMLYNQFIKGGHFFSKIPDKDSNFKFGFCFTGYGVIATSLVENGNQRYFSSVIGRILLLQRLTRNHLSRLVVICYKETIDINLIALAEGLDIEFLSPDEFIASLPDQDGSLVPA